MNTDINFQDFKCRCSRIGDMMSDSKDSPPLTEKQEQELKVVGENIPATIQI